MAIIIVTATQNATTKGRDYPGLILGRVLKNGRVGCACTRYRIVRVTPTLPSDLDGNRRVAAGSHFSFAGCRNNLQIWKRAGVWAPPQTTGWRFSAIFHIVKSGNCPLRYRNFAEFFSFLKKS